MVQSYKKNPKIAGHYDVIIIGSGMSALTIGALLSKEGMSVLLLEKHYTAGGFTHVFKRPGYEWDVGIHYVGEMGRKDSFSRRMSDYLTGSGLDWADMGDVYDRVVLGDRIYDFTKGSKTFKMNLQERFPDDREAIEQYFELVFKVSSYNQRYFIEKGLPSLLHKLIGKGMRRKLLEYSRRTTLDVLSGITENQELIRVLTAQFGDYGLPPAQSSFAMHAILVKHYFNGGYFPVGGSSQIVKTIDPEIEAGGGTIIVNASVEKVILEQNRAIGVKLEDGRIIKGTNIVSSAGVHLTANKLLPKEHTYTALLQRKTRAINASSAHICLYVGLNGTPEELKLPKANYWIYPGSGSHDDNIAAFEADITSELPLVYISFPAAKDPQWNDRYPGKSTIDILSVMPYSIFEKWEGSKWKDRPEEYEALKESLSQRLLQKLYDREPQTKGKVDYYELSTPLTTKNFVNYQRGEIYGLEHSPDRFDLSILRPRTGINNFYLTGQDISTAGVVGAMASGLLTASAITGRNLFKKIMKD